MCRGDIDLWDEGFIDECVTTRKFYIGDIYLYTIIVDTKTNSIDIHGVHDLEHKVEFNKL